MMRECIKVSFIVPVFNAERYLCRCLDSLVKQTLKDIEIICIDDASTDGSNNIIKGYAIKDERIHVLCSSGDELHPRNCGQSVARNVGLKAASGEYVFMVDADDWVELDAAEKIYNISSKYQLDILFFEYIPEYEDEKLRWKYKNQIPDGFTRKGACIDKVIKGKDMLILQTENNAAIGTIWSAVFNKLFLERNNISFDEELHYEDVLFILQTMLCAERTKCVSEVYYHYFRRYSSVTTSKFTEEKLKNLFMLAIGELKLALAIKNTVPNLNKCTAKWVGEAFSFVLKLWNDNIRFIDERKIKFSQPWQEIAFEVFKFVLKPEPSLHEFTDLEIRKIKQSEEVIVYGAGYIAGRTLIYLNKMGVNKIKIAVTHKEQEYFMGNSVYNIRDLYKNTSSSIVLIATMPDKQIAMMEMLESIGFQHHICMV